MVSFSLYTFPKCPSRRPLLIPPAFDFFFGFLLYCTETPVPPISSDMSRRSARVDTSAFKKGNRRVDRLGLGGSSMVIVRSRTVWAPLDGTTIFELTELALLTGPTGGGGPGAGPGGIASGGGHCCPPLTSPSSRK